MNIPGLKKIMKKLLLSRTQKELSEITGIKQGNISSYLHGRIEPNFNNSTILIELYFAEMKKGH